jgi:class 3 adenylate cyclase
MNPNRLISIRVSLAMAFAITVIVTSGFIGISTFFATRAFIRDGIRQRLQNITTLAVARLDAATHATIRAPADEGSENYARIKDYLREIKAVSPDIRFVYTYRVDAAGKVTFVVDAEDAASPDVSHVGDDYAEAPPLLRALYKPADTPQSETDFTTDKWGTWLSCYGPVTNAAGQVECGLGIDISAQAVEDYERGFLATILNLSALTGIVVLLVSIWYARRISQPLLTLAEDLGRVQKLELDHVTHIRSTVREVVVMREAVQKMKNGLRSFRKYVPADLVADLMALGQEARLSAEKREVTVFFSDVADFTAISEKTPPEQLVDNLSVYFDGMTRAIIETRGTVDKFIGDSVMAFWGAPRPLPDHAVQACRAAIRCRDHSRQVGAEQQQAGKTPMFTRIGLNTGVAIIGNIGYDARLNYTAMGDTVNLASRLEGLNKFYGTQILISEATWQLVKGAFEARFIDVVAVKGKSIPVRIYELLCERGRLTETHTRLVKGHEQAMELYLARQFAAAAGCFEKLVAAHPEDQPIALMLDRSRQFLANPPPAAWQGEFVMDSK